MTERHSFCKRRYLLLFSVLVALCLPHCGSLLAGEWDTTSSGPGHRVFPLTQISPERGIDLLNKLGLGTVTRLPAVNALLVTGTVDDIQKAATVLNLIDVPDTYEVRRVGPASALSSMPSTERIAAALGNIHIGTFAKPPSLMGKISAIVDVHKGSVWAIAPVFQVQDIALAMELGPDVLAQRSVRPNPAVANIPQAASAVSRSVGLQSPAASIIEPAPLGLDNLGFGVRPPRPLEPERAPRPLAFDLPLTQADANVAADANASDSEAATGLVPGQIVPEAVEAEEPAETVEPESLAAEAMNEEPVAESHTYEPITLVDGDRVIELALPEKLQVIQLLDLVAKYTNLDYIYDPAVISGEVTLKLNGNLRGSMKVRDLYLLLESVLKFKNLAMTRHRDNVVTIVPVDQALGADPQLVGPGEASVQAGDVVVTRVFALDYVDTTSAQNLLESMKLSVDVTPIAESGTLIVTAYAHRMARIEQLLKMVDRPGEPRKFQYRQLRYTMATNLAEKVKALAEQLESVSITVGTGDGSTTPATSAQRPGESTTAYRQRITRERQAAAARARAAATRQTTPEETTKPGVYLDADERTNRILMIGIEEQLSVVEDLIDALDVEQQDLRSMKLYRMQFVDAEEVSRKLQELGIITKVPEATTTSSRITGNTRNQNATAAAQARAAAAVAAATGATTEEVSEEGPVEEPQVVVVESTNSLLVNATPEQHARIEIIIGYVDSETLEAEIPYKIYALENSSPDHLATVLQSLIQETTQNQDQEGKIVETVVKKKEDEITIVPDPNTYSLIVYASKKNQEWISSLITKLDRRRPQVLIDVTLVEITKTDQFTYDLNLIESFPNLLHTSGVTGVDTTILDSLLSGPRDHFTDIQSDSGDFTGYYADRHVQVLLQAMKSKNYGRVLAKPKILVNDNEPGTIKTTETTYVRKESSIPVSGGGTGNDTTLVQTAVDYTPYDAGITLDITPHISEGDLLRLDVALTRSDFQTTEDTEKPPNTTTSEVATAVTVPDGSTVILGGLLKLNQNKGGTKVPLLGDLPLVGGLFRGVNNEDRQSKLYVFVKAEIIRPAQGHAQGMEDLEKLSERNRLAFEKHEQEFQEYQSWPGVPAKTVHPEKVLEAQ